MKILWMTWKDRKNPLAGGAEVVNEELAKRLAHDGHEVTFLVGGFKNGAKEDSRDGFTVIRVGGRHTVYWHAYRYYKKHLSGWPDLVIDEMNTMPFFAKYYVAQRNVLFVHQLCREIWFYQMPLPLSIVGYFLEAWYLRKLNDREVVAMSESTKNDLVRFGFRPERIHVISEGIAIAPLARLSDVAKFDAPTILSLGALRAMKRTDHVIKAFELVKKSIPEAKLVVAGAPDGAFGKRVVRMMERSPYTNDIYYRGYTLEQDKIELMRKAHVLCVTSVKEGWGLVVTEAASQGTPAVVYDVDGLRDSVTDGESGYLAKNGDKKDLAAKLEKALRERTHYEYMRKWAYENSLTVTFERSYREFCAALGITAASQKEPIDNTII